MTRTSTTILGALALALFAFIVLYERKTLTTSELRGAQNQLLERFVRSRVDGVEIERNGELAAKLRREREGDEDMLGTWRIVAPFEAAADDDAVSSLLGAIQYAAARRTLEDASAEDRTRYGLDEPRVVARFEVANERIEVRFGGDDPTGAGVYMATGDLVHVVGRDVFEALDRDAGAFRSKRLVEEGVLAAKSVRVVRGEATTELSRTETGWRVTVEEGAVLAASAKVEELLSAFNDLEAESFVSDVALGDAFLRVEATTDREGRDETNVLVVGAPCGDRGEERLARVDDGAIACVLTSRLDPLLGDPSALREDRPSTISDLEVASMTLALDGTTLRITRDSGAWKFALEGGGRTAEGEADDEAFAAWLREIRQARATSFAPIAQLEPYGLTRPRGRLELTDTEGARETLEIGAASTEGLFVRRADEPQVMVLPIAAEALLVPSTLRLRATRLWEHAEREVRRVVIARGRAREVLERDERGLSIVEPLRVRADRDRSERLARALARLAPSRVVTITDENVARARGEWLARAIERWDELRIVVAPGEPSKTLATVSRIWDTALGAGLDRNALVLAFGGGVVGDLGGFAASTLLRGVRCVQIPTSLLAMVDSSVGGKTGFDHPTGKNLLGSFFQPSRVLIDLEHLTTLPERERAAGLAEVVKIALVRDAPLHAFLEAYAEPIARGERGALREMVRRAVVAKMRVVREDETEAGVRALLNLGHTIGHALETHGGYARWLHGEAVAIGTVLELAATERWGLTPRGTSARARALLSRFGLPVEVDAGELAGAWPFVASDKKRAGDAVKLPIVEDVGRARVEKIPLAELRAYFLSAA